MQQQGILAPNRNVLEEGPRATDPAKTVAVDTPSPARSAHSADSQLLTGLNDSSIRQNIKPVDSYFVLAIVPSP